MTTEGKEQDISEEALNNPLNYIASRKNHGTRFYGTAIDAISKEHPDLTSQIAKLATQIEALDINARISRGERVPQEDKDQFDTLTKEQQLLGQQLADRYGSRRNFLNRLHRP